LLKKGLDLSHIGVARIKIFIGVYFTGASNPPRGLFFMKEAFGIKTEGMDLEWTQLKDAIDIQYMVL
jgi:hypothetical protein